MRHYTYAHYRNDTGKVFYVGKGVGDRAWSTTGRSEHWRRIASKHGYSVEILSRWSTEQEALQHEVFLIACLRALAEPLCNATAGGEGANGLRHTAETKARIAAAQKGRAKSAEARAKLSAARTGMKFSDEHRKNMAAVRLGKPGRPHTAEARAKIAAAKLGKPGHKPSDATKEKMRQAQQTRRKQEREAQL